MHRRIWFLAAVAVGLFGLAGSAAAMTTSASSGAKVLKAAPFAKAWANTPRTPAARAAKKTVVVAMEQDASGFNLAQANETGSWAAWLGETPVIRGNYLIDNKGIYHLDLAKKVKATKKGLTIWIRKNAFWYWKGHKKSPVTAKDYVYTYKQFVNPANTVASTTGYSQITRYKIFNKRKVEFFWKPAFADYKDLFGYIYPSRALKGLDFDTFWLQCVCGTDGRPVSDGPYYLATYTQGQGATLKVNPLWYGHKPAIKSQVWKLITNTNTEIQAIRGGEVDVAYPSPQTALAPLVHQSGLKYNVTNGFVQEHWDISQGTATGNYAAGPNHALLKKVFVRQAIMLGMNRQALIKALYNSIAPGLKPLDNPEYEIGPLAGKGNAKYAYFHKFNFNPKQAIKTLKSNGCTGGPSTPSNGNSKVWTCGGLKTSFNISTTAGNQLRETSEQVFTSQLMAVGIKLNTVNYPAQPTFFGTVLPSTDFDLGEFAWGGGPDPSGFDGIYQCFNAQKNLGGQNYKRYCNPKVDRLLLKGDSNLNPTNRTANYEAAAKIISDQVGIIPLYTRPLIWIYKSALKGAAQSNNPTSAGFTWNAERWHW
jgi:peptide/nickel transport system substrate-binding protein